MKYIFFDIDGTLVSHVGVSHIPKATLRAVTLLREAGHVPAIATGRGAFLARQVAREFGIDSLVCSGGAQIITHGRDIFTSWLPDGVLDGFRIVAERFPDRTAAIDDRYLYAGQAFSGFYEYFNGQAGYDCIRSLAEMRHAIICYVMTPHEMLTPEHELFFAPPEGVRLELMRDFTEARHEGTSKWLGIERLIEAEGADIEDVVVFGDGPNDAEMIERANIGVAVGRSSESAKKSADYVCEDIDEGGILKACKYLGLI